MGELCLKKMHPVSLRAAHLTTTAQGGECWSGAAPTPARVCPGTIAKRPQSGRPAHICRSWKGGGSLFREARANRNEFPDRSILLPGP